MIGDKSPAEDGGDGEVGTVGKSAEFLDADYWDGIDWISVRLEEESRLATIDAARRKELSEDRNPPRWWRRCDE